MTKDYCDTCRKELHLRTMTLSPEDKAKMEKAKETFCEDEHVPVIHLRPEYSEGIEYGYTAAVKDHDETIAELSESHNAQTEMLEVLATERDEALEAVDLMIVDRDDAYTKREQFRKLWSEAECDGDNLRVEVDRLREALEAIGKHALKSEQTTTYDEAIEGYRTVYEDLILHARATLTPQPADTVCHWELITPDEDPSFYKDCKGFQRDYDEHFGGCESCGRPVVLDTPCPECKGTGEHAGGRYRNGADAGIQCPECGGLKVVVRREKFDDPEMPKDRPCPTCQPCPECGTVGGGGKIHAYFDIAGLINYSGEIPCPRCGA